MIVNRNAASPIFDTFDDALLQNMRVGQVCIVKGHKALNDGLGAQYEVKANGSGGTQMANGNELYILDGETLKASDVSKFYELNCVDGQQVSLTGYHPSSTVGGGVFVYGNTGRHNGGTFIDPNRAFPTDWSDAGQVDAWFADSGVDVVGLERLNVEYVTPEMFGVVGDGVADDTAPIQATLTDSFLNQRNLIGSNITCRTTNTLFVGNYPDSTTYTSIDFAGMVIKPDDSVSIVVDSGKLVGGSWETAWNEPIETYMSFFTDFGGFRVLGSSDIAKTGRTAVRLKDWHYQCKLTHIGMTNFETGLSIKHVFGIELNQCSCFNTNPNNKTGQGFLLNDNVNLVTLKRCLSTNTEIGYHLQGGVSGVNFDNCSFEGQTFGLVCKDAVYAIEVGNCYFENITDTCFVFQSQVYAAKIANNYINLSTAASVNAYLFDYLELPNNNIQFSADNTVLYTGLAPLPDDHYIKDMNLHTTFGYNRLALGKKSSSLTDIDDLIVDNTNFPEGLDIDHTIDAVGLRAKVVNKYAVAQYSGRFSNGRDAPLGNGFEWIDDSSTTMNLRTKFTPSTAARIYVSLRISGGTLALIRGELIGDCNVNGNMDFYEYTPTGQDKTNKVTVSLVDGFFHLHYTHNDVVTAVVGELRLT